MTATALAVDLGSSSGRVIAGVLDDDRITETEVHRFPHTAAMRDGYLCWDLDLIRQEMIKGLQLAVERFPRRGQREHRHLGRRLGCSRRGR